MSRGWTINHNGIEYIMAEEYAAEVNHLAKKVKELEEVVMEQDEARVDLLAELMLLRQMYGDYRDMKEELTYLINLHSKQDRAMAEEQMKVVA
jgi:hypothetical protein